MVAVGFFGEALGREHLAVLVDAHDPALAPGSGARSASRWRSSSASSFARSGEKLAGLDLDQLAVRAHEVDHVAVDLDLERVAGRREQPL